MTILFPLVASDFARNIQEQRPLLMKSAADVTDFFWKDANEIIERCDVSSPDFKIAHDGIRPKDEYVESYFDLGTQRHRLIKPVIYNWLKQGATIIANKLLHEPKLDRFSKCIAGFTNRRIVSSVYASLGLAAASKPHWDTRDVFVIQLIGKKKWTLFRPTFESPLYIHQSREYGERFPCQQSPFLEALLDEGDVLYIPRGWWHDPQPVGGGTFHLSVGTFPIYSIDYLNWALAQMTECEVFRKSLGIWQTDRLRFEEIGHGFSNFLCDETNYRRFGELCASNVRENSVLAIDLFGSASGEDLHGNCQLRLVTQLHLGEFVGDVVIANGARVSLSKPSQKIISHINVCPGISLDALFKHFSSMERERVRRLIYQLCSQDILEVTRP